MELRLLEIFCRVVEEGGFSQAAESLNLTQPTVSIHIKTLEDALSTRLLDRLGRKVVPTKEGTILYRYAKEIVRLKEEASQSLKEFGGSVQGNLTIGASTIPGEYILPQKIAEFKRLYPGVFPSLTIADTEKISHMVLDGRVDIGVVGSTIKDKNLLPQKFVSDEIVLAAPSSFEKSRISREELARMPLVVREKGSGTRMETERAIREAEIEPEELNIVAEMGSTQALVGAVRSGLGLAFMSRLAIKEYVKRKILKEVKIKGVVIERYFHIITHSKRSPSPATRKFRAFLLGKEV
ncbi:MAG TPA: LysR family transcriptional regulator [Deltaproteobacteria bacterium]|nr:LysR family transcriptional regulator [Deltaproteobacteria bacterium]